jgi:hypothetical protein
MKSGKFNRIRIPPIRNGAAHGMRSERFPDGVGVDAFHRCDISMLADEYDRENQGHLARARRCARPKKMGIYYSQLLGYCVRAGGRTRAAPELVLGLR